MSRKLFLYIILLSQGSINAQVKFVNIVVNQPSRLTVEAGKDIVVANENPVVIGAEVVAKGGVPPYTCAWTNAGNIVSTSKSFETSSMGTFILLVTDMNNCSVNDSLKVQINSSLNHEYSGNYIIAPNPVQKELWIKSSKAARPYYIEILSITGKIVLRKQMQPLSEISIAMHDIADGIYFIRIYDKDGYSLQKFIKQTER